METEFGIAEDMKREDPLAKRLADGDPSAPGELVKRHREVTAALAELIRRVTKDADIELPMEAERAAVALLSLGIGLGAMRSLDPAIDVDVFGQTMRALLRGKAR